MAWRPTDYLIEGELDNTTPGKVAGWMKFAGVDEPIILELQGDFHRDIRGTKIRFQGPGLQVVSAKAAQYLTGFARHQTGHTGDMTAGLPPQDYVAYPYLEWYGDDNGRVVIELDSSCLQVIGQPIPAEESKPIDRSQEQQKMQNFLVQVAHEFGQANQK